MEPAVSFSRSSSGAPVTASATADAAFRLAGSSAIVPSESFGLASMRRCWWWRPRSDSPNPVAASTWLNSTMAADPTRPPIAPAAAPRNAFELSISAEYMRALGAKRKHAACLDEHPLGLAGSGQHIEAGHQVGDEILLVFAAG